MLGAFDLGRRRRTPRSTRRRAPFRRWGRGRKRTWRHVAPSTLERRRAFGRSCRLRLRSPGPPASPAGSLVAPIAPGSPRARGTGRRRAPVRGTSRRSLRALASALAFSHRRRTSHIRWPSGAGLAISGDGSSPRRLRNRRRLAPHALPRDSSAHPSFDVFSCRRVRTLWRTDHSLL